MAAEYGEPLSDRELEITELVAEGLTNREVAARLYLSPNTIKVHLRNIFTKTGVASRTELSMMAVQEGWITVPGVTDAADQEEAADEDEDATPDTPDEAQSLLPSWSWQRWAMLAAGLALAMTVLLLPQRPAATVAATSPGEVFGTNRAATSLQSPAVEDGWEERAPLPSRRAGMGITILNDHVYVIGGMTGNGPSDQMAVYDPTTDSWRAGTPRPRALANVKATVIDGRILVAGGCTDQQADDTVHLYTPEQGDPATGTWEAAAPLPVPLCAYALTTYRGNAYLFGGWDGEAYRALAYRYDPEDDAWEELRPPAQSRGFGDAATLEDRIFYVGGFDGRREWATCEVYFPESDRWESCPSMLQPRGGLSLSSIGGKLYAIGGGWESPLGFNERYTPLTDQWSVMETPIVGEWRNLGSAASETVIYTIGGWSGSDFLNRTYAVEIMPWRVFIPGTFRSP
jgi:DNA-binding CsgD family transcriptional regulator